MRNESLVAAISLVATGLLAVSVTGCGAANDSESEGGLTPLVLQLNSPGGGYNSGYALALERGYYEDLGIDLTIEPGSGSAVTAQLVASGKVDLAFSDAAAVMKLAAEGADMTIIGTVLQGNPNEVTSLASAPINSVAELKGKRVALPNGYSQTAMFPVLLEANGLKQEDMQVVNMPPESMVASLLQGQVDAILGSMDNFSVQLANEGADTVNLPFIDNGAATVAQSMIASNSFLKDHPDEAKAFVEASLHGWNDAIDDPKAALTALKGLFPDVNDKLTPGQLDATITLMCASGAEYVGKSTEKQWSDTVDLLTKIDLLPADVPAEDYYTYDYLPADDELRSCPLS